VKYKRRKGKIEGGMRGKGSSLEGLVMNDDMRFVMYGFYFF
jgi:hypothetical protein